MADATATTETPAPETFEFQAEARTLLGLMINSLYTHREVFLRELISNASDALDKARLRALVEHDLLGDQKTLEITVRPDKAARTLTISDSGIGMTRAELQKNLGTIARSGSKEFVEQLSGDQKKDAQLIGQFGVGFYSAFLVAGRVRVTSRAAGQSEAWTWSSEADGRFQLEPASRERRGTDVVLELREDQQELLDGYRLRQLIKQYSDFVGYPIRLVEEKDEGEGKTSKTDEVVNKGSALWTRPKAEITDEQYNELYKHVSHDWEDPLARSHFKVEGAQMFTGLLYLPKHPPFDMMLPKRRAGLRLYVKRVFVMEDCEALLPEWLRFVRGVIDSDDLPLNVSREVLQQERVVEQIKKQVAKKSLEMLEELAKEKPAEYAEFWRAFGPVLKEGLATDASNKERLEKLCRWESSTREGLVSLEEYVAGMKEGQEAIYYLTGTSRAVLEKSAHIEALKARGWEVLFFTDPVDEWVADAIGEFQEKKLVDATRGQLELKDDEQKPAPVQEEWKALIEAAKETLGERVAEVRLSKRLTESPSCLVGGEHDVSAQMERILRAHGRQAPPRRRILELNPDHELVKNLRGLSVDPAHRLKLKEWVELLFDQALLGEGSPLDDPQAFARRLNDLLLQATKQQLGPTD